MECLEPGGAAEQRVIVFKLHTHHFHGLINGVIVFHLVNVFTKLI